ncbi:MAG: hypothetical protein ACKVQJ_00450 [Pyrinomonadaceae bacterium]
MKNNLVSQALCLLVLLTCFLYTGCPDAQKAADRYFAKNGLNRLRIVNDAVQPGAVIVVNKDKKAFNPQNLLEYKNSGSPTSMTVKESNSVMPNQESDATMSADIALGFLSSMLPVSLTGKVKITSDVSISQASMKNRKIVPTEIEDYINSKDAQKFRERAAFYRQNGCKVYVAYEAFTANKFKLTSKAGSDISAGTDTKKINPILDSAKVGFSWVKNSSTELEISGDNYYTVALRTALVSVGPSGDLILDETTYAPVGVLTAADDFLKYSSSPVGSTDVDFQTLDMQFSEPTF